MKGNETVPFRAIQGPQMNTLGELDTRLICLVDVKMFWACFCNIDCPGEDWSKHFKAMGARINKVSRN